MDVVDVFVASKENSYNDMLHLNHQVVNVVKLQINNVFSQQFPTGNGGRIHGFFGFVLRKRVHRVVKVGSFDHVHNPGVDSSGNHQGVVADVAQHVGATNLAYYNLIYVKENVKNVLINITKPP